MKGGQLEGAVRRGHSWANFRGAAARELDGGGFGGVGLSLSCKPSPLLWAPNPSPRAGATEGLGAWEAWEAGEPWRQEPAAPGSMGLR